MAKIQQSKQFFEKINKYIFPKHGSSEDLNILKQTSVSVNKKLTWLLHWSIWSEDCAKQFL